MLDLHYDDGDDDDGGGDDNDDGDDDDDDDDGDDVETVCTFYLNTLLKLFVSLRKAYCWPKHVVLLNKIEFIWVKIDNNFVF
jgi:hypothetical protein